MARYYRRRYRTIVRAPKKKWASNIYRFNRLEELDGSRGFAISLVTNATQASSPTPVIVKAGNFKVQGDAAINVTNIVGSSVVAISLYVLYLPEGVTATNYGQVTGVLNSHPEWILAWKYVSANVVTTGSADNNESFTFSSRLKRNLNSGDSIVLAGVVESGVAGNLNITGMAQYWTCAN